MYAHKKQEEEEEEGEEENKNKSLGSPDIVVNDVEMHHSFLI